MINKVFETKKEMVSWIISNGFQDRFDLDIISKFDEAKINSFEGLHFVASNGDEMIFYQKIPDKFDYTNQYYELWHIVPVR